LAGVDQGFSALLRRIVAMRDQNVAIKAAYWTRILRCPLAKAVRRQG
jgi:hypothetical protein